MAYIGPISRNSIGSQINYITAGTATDGIAGWNLYNDASAAPVDGTGGTATITFSRNTSSPLRAGADFLLTKPASNVQGQGVSYDFTIDTADLGQDLVISFDYELVSGTYASGDVSVFIIQSPSATPTVLTPSGGYLETVAVGATRKEYCFFKASSTVTSYRICIHVASTSASAYSLSLDNVYVGPVSASFLSLNFVGTSSAPSISDSGSARLYYDTALNRLRVSQNGGAYTDLGTGGGGGMVYPSAGIAVSTGSAWNTSLSIVPVSSGGTGSNTGSISGTGVLSFASGTTTSEIRFFQGGSERARIDANGRILIGTTSARAVGSPTRIAQFQIEHANSGLNSSASLVTNGNDAVGSIFSFGKSRSSSVGGVTAVQSGDDLGIIRFAGADGTDVSSLAAEVAVVVDGAVASGDVPGRISFRTKSSGGALSERLRIDSAGRLLIGSTSVRNIGTSLIAPALQIEGINTNTSSLLAYANANNATNAGILVLGKSRGTSVGSVTAVQNGDALGCLHFMGADGTSGGISAAFIIGQVDGTVATNVMPGALTFWTTPASSNAPTERLRIDSSGRVLIGTTTATNNIRNSAKLGVVSVGGVNGDQGGAQLTHYSAGNSSLAPILDFATSNGASDGSMTAVGAAQFLGQVAFRGSDGTNFNTACIVRAESDGTVSSGVVPGRLSIHTANTSGVVTERLRIDSSGNVGIGTTSPLSTLDVNGSITVGRSAASQSISVYNGDATNRQRLTLSTSGTDAVINATRNSGTVPNLIFQVDTVERLRIDSSGNVGIGTNSPSKRLEVTAATNDSEALRINAVGASGSVQGIVRLGLSYYASQEPTVAIGMEEFGVADARGSLLFYTRGTNSDTTAPLERLRIDSSGNVGIGVTSPTRRLEVGGTASGNNNAIVVGTPTASANNSGLILFRDDTATDRWATGILQQTAATAFSIRDIVAGAERLRITSAGLVGINTTSPASTNGGLDIASGGLSLVLGADASAITRTNATEKQARIAGYHYTNAEEPVGGMTITSTVSTSNVLIGGGSSSINATTLIGFYTAANTTTTTGTLRGSFDSAGRFLLGATTTAYTTASVNARFQLTGNDANSGSASISRYSADTSPPYLVLAKSRSGTVGTMTAVASNDELGRIEFAGADGTDLGQSGAFISAFVDGTVATNSIPGRLSFWTTEVAGTTPTERLRIDASGDVGIGGTPLEKLDVFGAVKLSDSSGNQTIYQTSTAGRVLITANNSNAIGSTAAMILRGSTHATNPGMVELWTGNTGRLFIDTSGNVGIGTASPSTRLEVAGQVKITGGSPGAGKVLTSDASGLATWETPTGGSSSGPITTPITSYTGSTNYNITSTDSTVLLTANGGVITATLPSAVGIAGRQYTIKRTGSGAASYSVTTTASQTIDKAATFVISNSSTFLSVVTVQSDGSNWVVISKS